MSDRQELKEELKKDARKAWEYIKQGAKKIGTYALLTLTLSSNQTSSNQFQQIEQDYKSSLENHEKLDNKLIKSNENAYIYDGFLTGFNEPSLEQKVEKIYEDLTSKQEVKKDFSIAELMEKAGVNSEDIQEVFSENKDLLKDLVPGQNASALAKSADKVKGENKGGCLGGAQNIFISARLGDILCGSNPDWPDKIKGCDSNSACNAYIPLEKSGKFINVTFDNIAYNKSRTSPESQELVSFSKTLPAGSIVITDNKLADSHLGRRYTELSNMYGTGGKLHGHIAIKDNHGLYKEEGVAIAPSFHNYGKTFKVSLSTDYKVPKELAMKLIAAKENRETKEIEQQKKSHNFVLEENYNDNKTTIESIWMQKLAQTQDPS